MASNRIMNHLFWLFIQYYLFTAAWVICWWNPTIVNISFTLHTSWIYQFFGFFSCEFWNNNGRNTRKTLFFLLLHLWHSFYSSFLCCCFTFNALAKDIDITSETSVQWLQLVWRTWSLNCHQFFYILFDGLLCLQPVIHIFKRHRNFERTFSTTKKKNSPSNV